MNQIQIECPNCLSGNVSFVSRKYIKWNPKNPDNMPHVRRLYYCNDCNEYFVTTESVQFWSPIFQDACYCEEFKNETEERAISSLKKLKRVKRQPNRRILGFSAGIKSGICSTCEKVIEPRLCDESE